MTELTLTNKMSNAEDAETDAESAEVKHATTKLDFPDWVRATSPHLAWDARHHKVLFKRLERMTSRESNRLMIFMPPRHGKSETVTIHYAAWRLERDPMLNIIIGSYNQKLANRFSRKVRAIAKEHKLALSKERFAADEWETREGGGVRAVGVGAGVTGFGGGLVIIDDPIRGRADAESAAFRDKTYEWFTDDIYTRLTPDGQVILIQTRWHEDDLAGRLLKHTDGDKWDVLRLPAIAEEKDELERKPGEALWPAKFDAKRLEAIRRLQGHYSFESLYQQNPVPKSGDLFQRSWFTKYVDSRPTGLTWVRGYDLAISEKTSADYTASFRVAKDRTGNYYIDGGIRRQIDFPTQRRLVEDLVRNERDTVHYIEDALHGRALYQDLKAKLTADRARLKSVRVEGDKYSRALTFAGAAENGLVHLVRGSWNAALVDELSSFPKGRHDDQVDAITLAFNAIEGRKGKGFHAFD
ncbi:MAG: phage terminase large subunit [Acidobacteria bacterium]|nr:phage terminase large subunit [Acidobacteriota bacterium]